MSRLLPRIVTALLLSCAILPAAHAQEGISKEKQEKNLRKKEKSDVKEVRKEEKRIAKKHLANQDKATRKRMKKHNRRADKHGKGRHRDSFLQRLFGRKH
ncbi:MAG: hypothetical protein KDC01_07270 [Flavobacteriales bacterium]|jgi:hypothetical protein|nr:hypothetical protein [Flavobacteriales bacterium]